MRQNLKRRARNFPLRSEMKSAIKRMEKLLKEGALDDAIKFLGEAYSVIDTACKKKIIEKNNAARKKSRLARLLKEAQEKKGGNVAAAPEKEAVKAKKEEE